MRTKTMKTVAAVVAAHLAAIAAIADDTGRRQQDQQDVQRQETREQAREVQPGERIDEPAGAQREVPEAKHFIKQAAVGNKLEVVLGQLAQQKAQNPQVRQFGEQMSQEHQQANKELQQVAQQKGVTMDPSQFQQVIQARGQQFDQAFLTYITTHGGKNVQYLEKIASQHPDQQVQQFARQQVTEMRQHLQQAQQLQSQIQAAGAIQEPAGAQPEQQLQQESRGEQIEEAAGAQRAEQQMPEAGEFVKQAKGHAKLGIALSELASQKTENAQLRQLAQQKQQSIQQAAQQLKQLGQQHGVEVDLQPIQQLTRATGTQFDQAYVRYITEEHRKAVQAYEKIAAQHPDQEIQQYARKMLPELKQHLQHAQRLQTQVQAGGTIQEPAGAQPDREPQQDRD